MLKKYVLITAFLLFIFPLFDACPQAPDAEVVRQRTDITIKRGRLEKRVSYEIQINNRNGDRFTNVTIPYSKLNKVSKVEAHLRNKNGDVVRKITGNQIGKRSAISDFSLYQDEMELYFSLRHHEYPYTLAYSYVVKKKEFLYIDYWLPVLEPSIPTRVAELTLEKPYGYKISNKNDNLDSVSLSMLPRTIRYKWMGSYERIIRPESFSPPVQTALPYLIVVPQSYKYDLQGSFVNWRGYGNWLYRLMQDGSELPQREIYTVLGRIEGISDTLEIIKTLYNYLQDETRYVNVTIETGGMKPYPAAYVAEKKFGDCKALTNYFQAVLRVAGVKSFYTVINAGNRIVDVDRDFPSQQFNHAILCVPVDNDTLWIDCTSKHPLNYLGTFLQNRDVFIVDRLNSRFTRTKALTKEDVVVSRNISVKPVSQSNAEFEVLKICRGEEYERLSIIGRNVSESAKHRMVSNYFIESGFDASEIEIHTPNRDSAFIKLTYKGTVNNLINGYANGNLLRVVPFTIPHLDAPENRVRSLQIDYPIFMTDTLLYHLPYANVVTASLNNTTISGLFGEYHFEFTNLGDKVLVTKSLLIHEGRYQTSSYAEFYQFLNQIRSFEENLIFTTTKTESL